MTVQQKTAMEENSKQKIISNDLVRRLYNTMEDLDQKTKCNIVDNYSQKLLNSGYTLDQTRRTITNGIKGYGSRVARCQKMGRPLRRTGASSKHTRTMKKLLSKSSWYRLPAKEDLYKGGAGSKGRKGFTKEPTGRTDVKSTLFVNYTKEGELAKLLRSKSRGWSQ